MNKSATFQFASCSCGLKKTKKPDLALIYSKLPCTYAGGFTTNQVRAACIDDNKILLQKRGKINAIVINSGNANACTGKNGIKAIQKIKEATSQLLKINSSNILTASTGIIGVELNTKKLINGLKLITPKLSSSNNHLRGAAKAILTTDRFIKIVLKKTKDFKLIGFAKGAGMIHPQMATMLCFFFTDLQMSQNLLQEALNDSIQDTFNVISVDGDMSTNDMVILLSNNQSKKYIKSKNDPLYKAFKLTLYNSCLKLAKEIVIDGEGAKKIISVNVINAKTKENARKIARSISSSTLFKCAVFGSDPNWGRAIARVGTENIKIDQNKIDVLLNKTLVYKNGNPVLFKKERLKKEIKRSNEVKVTVNLKLGKESAFAFGCDLSVEYVKFNSGYFS